MVCRKLWAVVLRLLILGPFLPPKMGLGGIITTNEIEIQTLNTEVPEVYI